MKTGICICKQPFTFTGMNYAYTASCKMHGPVAFIGANQDSCILNIWPFMSAYTYVSILLGYCVHFTETMLQRSVPLSALVEDAANLCGQSIR